MKAALETKALPDLIRNLGWLGASGKVTLVARQFHLAGRAKRDGVSTAFRSALDLLISSQSS